MLQFDKSANGQQVNANKCCISGPVTICNQICIVHNAPRLYNEVNPQRIFVFSCNHHMNTDHVIRLVQSIFACMQSSLATLAARG